MATYSKASLYYFAKSVLDYEDMTPELHLPFCNFIQLLPWNGGPPESRKKMAWMPRGHLKSSICSIAFPLWLMIHDINVTIALFSAKLDNPKKWLRQIKTIIDHNPMFKMAFPHIKPAWDKDANRKLKWDATEIIIERDPSWSGDAQATITCASMQGGQASQHWFYRIIDDPVNEDTAKSEPELESAIDTYKYMDALGRGWDTGGELLIGTPYGRGDVMEWAWENQVKSGKRLYWGIGARGEFRCSDSLEGDPHYNVDLPLGEPILPSKCPEEMLQQLENEDLEKYYLQYLCKPYDAGRNGFNLDLVRPYALHADGDLKCECHPLHKHNLEDMVVIGTCDPAASQEKSACRSAITIMAKARCGCRFLLDEWAERKDPFDVVDKIIEYVDKWKPYLRSFGIETVGFQRMLKGALEQAQDEGTIPLYVKWEDLKPDGRNKDARVLSQQTPVQNGYWHRLPSAGLTSTKQNLIWELSKFPFGKLRDLIDAGFGYCDDMWTRDSVNHMRYDSKETDRLDWNAIHDAEQARHAEGAIV